MVLFHSDGRHLDAVLSDLRTLVGWLDYRERHVVVDPNIERLLTLPAELLPPTVVDGRVDGPLEDLLARPGAVLLGSHLDARPNNGIDVQATVASTPYWVTTHPRSYAGITVAGVLGELLFWRGVIDRDLEVDAVIEFSDGAATVIRTTTGWRLDGNLGWRPREHGARWPSRSALYAAYLGLHRPQSVSSPIHDAATLAAHLTEAGIHGGRVVLNGEPWQAVPVAYAPEPSG